MKRIDKRIPFGVALILGALALSLCSLGIAQSDRKGDNIEGSVAEKADGSSLTGRRGVSEKSGSLSQNAIEQNPEKGFTTFEKNDPKRHAQLYPEDAALGGQASALSGQASAPGEQAVAPNGQPEISPSWSMRDDAFGGDSLYYKLEDIEDTGDGKKLTISASALPGGTPFDSSQSPPWVNENQYQIKEIEIEGFVKPKTTVGWFGCQAQSTSENVRLSDVQTIVGLDGLDMADVTDASYMFCGSDILERVEGFPRNWNNVSKAEGICNYTNLDNEFLNKVANSIANTATNMDFAFANNFKENQFTSFKIDDPHSQVSTARYLFYRDSFLQAVSAQKLIAQHAISAEGMFRDCPALKSISLMAGTDWSDYAMNDTKMFFGCASLMGGAGTAYSPSHVDKAYAKCDGGKGDEGYFTADSLPITYVLAIDGNGEWQEEGTAVSSITVAAGEVLPEASEAVSYVGVDGAMHTVVAKPAYGRVLASCSYDDDAKTFTARFTAVDSGFAEMGKSQD